ncbi:ATP-binding protein [Candidatus Sumerlaeota bacterium]|nr:ATP-binding protein [Candidatus Sumerlaeota bacterium]
MRIAVASGKGGTGKTTVATNLATVTAQDGRAVAYLDCDVEEPNGALFLKPAITESRDITVSIPKVDLGLCTHCGLCGRICQYSAITPVNKDVLVFPELCHSCGGCWLVCPVGAITESPRAVGKLDTGMAGNVHFVQGILNIGESRSVPVISQVKKSAPEVDLEIIDSPPGTSCPVIESVRDADFVLLVTEPTPFGLNDLELAVETMRALGIPFGVVVNRSGIGDDRIHAYCRGKDIPILADIPDDRKIAEAYSRGDLIVKVLPEYQRVFENLMKTIYK